MEPASPGLGFYEAWRHFDRELAAATAIIRSAEDSPNLVTNLDRLHDASAALYDFLMQDGNADLVPTEEALELRDEAKAVRDAAEAASKTLADRLNRLYDVRGS